MTPEMIDRARRNASRRQLFNVEFRLGEIEHLPIANDTINCLISNCVINLAQVENLVHSNAILNKIFIFACILRAHLRI